jgi:sec-independent protein translocase protein TatC
MGKAKSKPTRRDARNQLRNTAAEKIPFIAHIQELRKRLFYVVVSICIFGGIAALFQTELTKILLKPSGGQQFIFTTPGGGFDFVFKLILYAGIAGSIPVIVYQFIKYMQPLTNDATQRFVVRVSLWSSLLAIAGICFGYSVGLPAAMHFLLQGFSTEQIKALITIQSYMSFVMIYLLGTALLFQLPLLLIVINKFKRLKPRTLLKQQRWVILGSAIAGAIISPTPDIRNMLMLSGPIVLTYELSIVLIWLINRRHKRPKKVIELLRKDAEVQAERLAKFEEARAMWRELLRSSGTVQAMQPVAAPTPIAQAAAPVNSTTQIKQEPVSRSQRYARRFRRQNYASGQRAVEGR